MNCTKCGQVIQPGQQDLTTSSVQHIRCTREDTGDAKWAVAKRPSVPPWAGKYPLLGAEELVIDLALALVKAGPRRNAEWMLAAAPMCAYCHEHEDVNQAASRILAQEVRRLTGK